MVFRSWVVAWDIGVSLEAALVFSEISGCVGLGFRVVGSGVPCQFHSSQGWAQTWPGHCSGGHSKAMESDVQELRVKDSIQVTGV